MYRLIIIFSIFLSISCSFGNNSGHTLSAELSQDKEYIIVNGTSNLPNQAQITVALLDTSITPAKLIVQEFGNVSDGKFKARFKPLKPLKAGSYTIRLNYSPSSYDWSGGKVLESVGKNGEKLQGKFVHQDTDGMYFLEHLISFEYKEP